VQYRLIRYILHITGRHEIGIKMTLVSFAVEVILDSITAENKGTRIDGMDNVCIRVFELSHNFVIHVRHLHSIDSCPAYDCHIYTNAAKPLGVNMNFAGVCTTSIQKLPIFS